MYGLMVRGTEPPLILQKDEFQQGVKVTTFPDKLRQERVNRERLDWMMGEMRLHLAGGVFAAVLLALVFSSQVPAASLWLWAGLNLAVTLVGVGSLALFYFRRSVLSTRGWGRFSVVMMLLWGLVLATSPWLFLTTDNMLYVATLLVLLVGICASPASTLALYPWAYAALVTPVMASLTWAIREKQLSEAVLINWLVPVFWLFLLGYGWRLHQVLLGTITSRLEKEEALRRLERSQALRSRFLAAATHDVRQPLQAISLHLGVLRDRFAGQDEARLLERLHDSTESMSTLMDALLDVSRLDNDDIKPDLRPLALKPVLEKWLRQYAAVADGKGLAVRAELQECVVTTDPLLLERIFLNLFSNAVRYTDAGEVVVRLRHRDGAVVMSISDTGCGIPDDKRQKIFEAFQYLDNPERDRSGGLGLGLAIVERLASLLGHELAVDSEVGKGSTFSLILPRASRSALPSKPASPSPAWENPGLKVMVIDDNREVREALGSLLDNWQCKVHLQGDGTPPQDWMPDLVLTDYYLKDGETGVDTIARLREKAGACIPAVILTGDASFKLPAGVRRMALLRKPVRPVQLRSVMQKLLRSV